MKKILTLSIVLAISTGVTFAASNFGNAFKNAVKQDIEASNQEIKNYNASIKEALKQDMQAKEAENLKEINSKIAQLNKEKANIQSAKNMTYTEKTLKTKAIDKKLEYLNKQKNALK